VGAGAKYHFKYTALAVIFDTSKRTSPSLIRQAVRAAALAVAQRGAKSIIIPDMTENLLAQPNWVTREQARVTSQSAAAALAEAIRACRGAVKTIRVWVWDPAAVEIYRRELVRLESGTTH
jgi:hypothetical protein